MFSPQRISLSDGFGRFIKNGKSPTVGRLEILGGKSYCRRTTGNQSHIEKDDIIKVFDNCLQVMMDNKDGFACRPKRLHQCDDC